MKAIDLDSNPSRNPDDRALVALLGRNGAGKSSILYALDVFYDLAARITIDDCYAHDSSNEIMIRITYGSLRDEERSEFGSYIENDKLMVTKRLNVSENGCTQKYFAAARQIPRFAELRKLGKSDRTKAFKQLVAEGTLAGLEGNPKSADQTDVLMSEFEALHPDLLETVEREEQFFGPKQIGGGKLDKFTKFVLVPAVRNAADEQKRGVIFELIDLIVLRQVNKRQDVQNLRAEMKEKIEKIFCQNNLTELGTLGYSISKLLGQYAPGCALNLSWGDPTIPEIPLPKANANLVEDDFPCPITHTGHGLQRSLILTLLQYLATVELPAEEADSLASVTTALPQEVSATGYLDPDLILAIEEPELYLHPSRCRHLSELLLTLTRQPSEVSAARNQIFYATHSPYFVDLHRFDQIRIARKPRNAEIPAPCCVLSQYSLDQAARELATIANASSSNFSRDSFRARTLPVMTTAVNEGFFAHVVVVVEGLADVGVLWTIQSKIRLEWAARGITVVPALGKENIDRPVVVFRGLEIPTYFLFDGDARHKATSAENQTKARNVRYQRMAGVVPVDFPVTQYHDSWAVFEDEMEKEIRLAVGVEFDEIAKIATEELRCDGPKQLMKNTEGAARLVDLIYAGGKRIPVLEEIVRRVTALCDLHVAVPLP